MNDEKLYNLCKFYGTRALAARQKFLGLLPEVFRRRLYGKKNFSSIFEFAKKLCGVSEKQVRMVLGLYGKFEEMPALRNALTSGEVSSNKLARIASIATTENQSEICEKAKILSTAALNTFAKDIRNQNGLFKTKNEPKVLYVQNLDLNEEVIEKLSELKNKGIDINEMLLDFLKGRAERIAEEKEKIAQGMGEGTRYVPAKVKRILREEYGEKCSVKNCRKIAEVIHHTLPFAVGQTNDPRFLAPMCEEHHKIAHLNNVKFAEISTKNWT